VLNVVLGRPIFSPTDFIQIKGRGTRLFTFKHAAAGRSAEKDGFALFDFFANCEFFEEKFDYDRKLTLPKGPVGDGSGGDGGGGTPPPETYSNTSPDPMQAMVAEPVGPDGMKIDREMFRARFADEARALPALQQAVGAGDWPGAEALFEQVLAHKPEAFWSQEKLRDLFKNDRLPGFREILEFIFGLAPGIADREQLAREHFERFLATGSPDATKIRELRHVFHAFVLNGEARGMLERGDFATLRALDAGLVQSLKAIGPEQLAALKAYIAANVWLDDFIRVA
jgi:type I restriction enzyme R subunit